MASIIHTNNTIVITMEDGFIVTITDPDAVELIHKEMSKPKAKAHLERKAELTHLQQKLRISKFTFC